MRHIQLYEDYLIGEIYDNFELELDDFLDEEMVYYISQFPIFTNEERNYLYEITHDNEELFEGFKNLLHGVKNTFSKGYQAVKGGIKKIPSIVKSAGQKVMQVAKILSDIVREILSSFVKNYLTITKTYKEHNRQLADIAYKRFKLIHKATPEFAREELEWLENSYKFLKQTLASKIKQFYNATVKAFIKDLLNPTESESEIMYSIVMDRLFEDIKPEGSRLLPSAKTDAIELGQHIKGIVTSLGQRKGVIGRTIRQEKNKGGSKLMSIPKGFFKGLAKKMGPFVDKIDNFVDTWFEPNQIKYKLKVYAKVIEKIGGPSAPDSGFKSLSIVHNFAAVIVDPSPIGRTFWRDRESAIIGTVLHGTKTLVRRIVFPGINMLHSYMIFRKKLEVTYFLVAKINKDTTNQKTDQ